MAMIGRMMVTVMAASALAACVSAGTEVTPQQMAQFSEGTATYEDVTKSLGDPTTTFYLPNGGTTIVYSFSTAYAPAQVYIPFAGPFIAPDLNTRESAAVFRFNGGGVLASKAMSNTYVGTDVGLTDKSNGGPKLVPPAKMN
jgi:hypothetical protein